MTDITMPRLSDSMEQGTILTWLIKDGQPVAAGDDLVEVETDKATVTHSAAAGGILEIVAAQGDTVTVGAVIARVGTVAASLADEAPNADADPALTAPAPVVAQLASNRGGAAIATPIARRIAAAHDITLDQLTGTGPRCRVTRADVLSAAGIVQQPRRRRAEAVPAATSPEAPRDLARGDAEVQEPTRLQQVVARRMVEAKQTVPHFQVQTEVTMDAAIGLRAQLKAAAGTGDTLPSFNDLIVKACALALRAHPRANGSFRDGRFELHSRVNVGVAVAADDALVVPTIFDTDKKSIGQIARDVRDLAARVRDGKIRPEDLAGGTFTVSNLGMYGMTAITPVVNVPQAAIVGVGAVREILARVDGEIVDRTLMTLTLSCDHRILYGTDAARLLADIRDLLEQPLRLIL